MVSLQQVELHDLLSSDCIADLKLHKKIHLGYPGPRGILPLVSKYHANCHQNTVYLGYQKKSKGPGMFGTVVTFAPADKE